MKLFFTGVTNFKSSGTIFHRHRWINLDYVIGIDLNKSEEEFFLEIWMSDGMKVLLSGEEAMLFLKLPEVKESLDEFNRFAKSNQ